ncbi:Acyltransferase family [Seminavis robusta]|uniref:Acyltransferase family n=1 Tax=Seminavis robusta TaxID=568900 RepID=A0A9N8EA17_9STRA|nr:Acyltransferase family [Seminavis robusta]|eukprot:Sro794_g203440.1 Acyltransferase family (573) ;mRNA; r:37602-39320
MQSDINSTKSGTTSMEETSDINNNGCRCSCCSFRLTLWCLGLLGLMGIQVTIDKTVQEYLGQSVTSLMMILLVTGIYVGGSCRCTICTHRKQSSRSSDKRTEAFEEQDNTRSLDQEEGQKRSNLEIENLAAESTAESSKIAVTATSVTEVHAKDDGDDNDNDILIEEEDTPVPVTSSRLVFLDNLKSFLTFLVVTLHVNCAFGGCQDFWFLVVGESSQPPIFAELVRQSSMLLQGFFMPLFFFVSAYFVPNSFRNKRTTRDFIRGKRQRLYDPAIVLFLTVLPLTAALGHWVATPEQGFTYILTLGHLWFNIWLLTLHWVYSTLAEQPQQEKQLPFPSTYIRMTAALLFCGVLLLPFPALMGPVTFGGMPLLHGSVTCDLFLYAMGIMARNHEWLQGAPLADKMDISPWLLRGLVLLEASTMVILFYVYNVPSGQPIWALVVFFLVSGVYTVDMGLALVQLFQSVSWQRHNRYSRFFHKAAYTVYLIHPTVIVAVSAAYVHVFNVIVMEEDRMIVFDPTQKPKQLLEAVAPPGQGAEEYYAMGWCIVFCLSQLIVWPLSYGIAHLPYLNRIL